jgi:hypothetical protein
MGGSEAESPVPPDVQQAAGVRASDADRDEVADRLRDEYVAGRLSHDTFLHRMDAVLAAKHQADLPSLLDGLPVLMPTPARTRQGLRGLVGRLRGAWSRWAGLPGGVAAGAPDRTMTRRPPRGLTRAMQAAGDHRQPQPLRFPRGEGSQFSIGRDASCDMVIVDMSVSRRHAILERTPVGWLLTDLESTNGTRVNGWRTYGQVPVRPGDEICFGNIEYVVQPGDGPMAGMS